MQERVIRNIAFLVEASGKWRHSGW